MNVWIIIGGLFVSKFFDLSVSEYIVALIVSLIILLEHFWGKYLKLKNEEITLLNNHLKDINKKLENMEDRLNEIHEKLDSSELENL